MRLALVFVALISVEHVYAVSSDELREVALDSILNFQKCVYERTDFYIPSALLHK